jgi:hypothetical protein
VRFLGSFDNSACAHTQGVLSAQTWSQHLGLDYDQPAKEPGGARGIETIKQPQSNA